MYRVLLAEDEVIVRHGIKALINQSGQNLTIVADVANGQLAWEAFQAHSPEIVITDLRMPIMDGLSLIRKIRESGSDCIIIILTCLDDFDFVREAIDLNVFSYQLKLSAGPDEITAVLKKVIQKLDKDGIHASPKYLARHLIISQLFDDYIIYGRIDTQTFRNFIQRTGTQLQDSMLRLCLVRLDPPDNAEDEPYSGFSLDDILEKLDSAFCCYTGREICAKSSTEYIVIYNEPVSQFADSVNCRLTLLTALQKAILVPVTIGISCTGRGFCELSSLYRSAYTDLCGEESGSEYQHVYIQLCKQYLAEHFSEQLSLQSVAAIIGITPNYLSSLFVKYTGETFTSFLNTIRIEEVKRLMVAPGRTTGSLGRQVGYDNESYFIRVFKKHTGLTPNQYREKHMRL